jgi:anti-anti-sigma regulatory factor
LGTGDDRIRWVARVTSARIEVVRALQEEFDRVTQPHWKLLLEAKRNHAISPSTAESQDTLNRLLASLHEAVRRFIYQRKQQIDSVGLQVEAVMTFVEATSRAWVRTPQLAFMAPDPAPLRAVAPEFQAFLTEPLLTPWREAEADETALYEDAILRISQTGPQALRIMGSIDVSNSEAISRTLKTLPLGGGEYHLDFGGLLFCDLAGLRMIMEAGQSLADPGKLYLDNLPPHVAHVAELAGWSGQPTVVLVPLEAQPA